MFEQATPVSISQQEPRANKLGDIPPPAGRGPRGSAKCTNKCEVLLSVRAIEEADILTFRSESGKQISIEEHS